MTGQSSYYTISVADFPESFKYRNRTIIFLNNLTADTYIKVLSISFSGEGAFRRFPRNCLPEITPPDNQILLPLFIMRLMHLKFWQLTVITPAPASVPAPLAIRTTKPNQPANQTNQPTNQPTSLTILVKFGSAFAFYVKISLPCILSNPSMGKPGKRPTGWLQLFPMLYCGWCCKHTTTKWTKSVQFWARDFSIHNWAWGAWVSWHLIWRINIDGWYCGLKKIVLINHIYIVVS